MKQRCSRHVTAIPSTFALLGGGIVTTMSLPAHAQGEPDDRLSEIIVTSSLIEMPRRQIGTAVSLIMGEEMELRGYNSLADILRTQPSVGVSNAGGVGQTTTLRIRGEEAFRTLLMIDGVKTLDPSAPQVVPSFDSLLTTSDLERVEILRGPQGFIYGADAGGVVSVLTRRGAGDPGGRVGLELGEFGTRRYDASVAGGSEAGDYFLSVTDFETDGFNAQSADTALADDDGAENTTLHAKLGWNTNENVRLQLVARDIDASSTSDGCFSLATFATVHDCAATTEQTTYKASVEHSTERFGSAFGYSEVDIVRDSFTEAASSFATKGTITRFEYTGTFSLSESAAFVYGLDLQSEEVVSSGMPDERDQDGYYAEYQGAFADSFFLSIGARYDDNEDFGSATSTRLSATYVHDLASGSSLKYRASYGTGFRAPSLFEIAYNERPFGVYPPAAASPLTEETSAGYDLGIEYNNANDLHFEATYFDHEIENQVTYTFDPLTFEDGYIQPHGISESKGIELAAEVPIGAQLELIANWTDNDTTTVSNDPRLRRPDTLANLGLRFTSPSDRFQLLANYRISRDAIDRDFTTGEDVALDDYEVLDLSMQYAFNELFELYARIENATDEEYEEVLGYNTPGRSGFAGVRFRF